MHEVLVNRLGGLSLPRKSVVRLTDRLDMTLVVYRGRKTAMQQQQQEHHMQVPTLGCGTRLQLLLENSKSIRGHNYVKKMLRVTCPTGMGFHFDSKQLV